MPEDEAITNLDGKVILHERSFNAGWEACDAKWQELIKDGKLLWRRDLDLT